MTGAPDFNDAFRQCLTDLLIWRRDVRRFRKDSLPDGMLDRLIKLAALAPSVGLSEPWRFVSVEDPTRRQSIRDNFERCNADALQNYKGEQAALYAKLKLAGLDEAPCHLAVFTDYTTLQGHGLGRQTMPEMINYSTVAAIHTLWLVARAEGIGMGWVSILDPTCVAADLDIPPDWHFTAYLCLGFPQEEDNTPTLERLAWEHRQPQAIIRR